MTECKKDCSRAGHQSRICSNNSEKGSRFKILQIPDFATALILYRQAIENEDWSFATE